MAVSGGLDLAPYAEVGWRVLGRLPATPYDDPRDAPSYLDVDELIADERVDAVALDRGLVHHLPALGDAGMRVLLPEPWPLDPGVLRAGLRSSDGEDALVAFRLRWRGWAQAVAGVIDQVGPILQVTVRGWPTGAESGAELLDVLGRCAPDLGAPVVACAGAALPVAVLPDGASIAWSVATESGATVLVSHGGPRAVVRFSGADRRLEASADGVEWVVGEAVAGQAVPLPADRDGLRETAQSLLQSGRTATRDPTEGPATVATLLMTTQVLAALRRSAATGVPETVS